MSEATYDDFMGAVDLFGALIREELETALDELAFKQGRETDGDVLSGVVSGVVDAYYLVSYEDDETDMELLMVGLMALPTLPDWAEDLLYTLDCPTRKVPRDKLATWVESHLRAAVASTVQTNDADEIRRLLGVTHDLEAWADIDVGPIRKRLDAALDAGGQA